MCYFVCSDFNFESLKNDCEIAHLYIEYQTESSSMTVIGNMCRLAELATHSNNWLESCTVLGHQFKHACGSRHRALIRGVALRLITTTNA